MNIHEAIKALRASRDQSQQAFATEIGISIRALASYEKDQQPSAKALLKLIEAAQTVENTEIREAITLSLLERANWISDSFVPVAWELFSLIDRARLLILVDRKPEEAAELLTHAKHLLTQLHPHLKARWLPKEEES